MGTARGVRYRVAQFIRAIGARPTAADLALVDSLLSPAERRLFDATAPRDQAHQVKTLRLLVEELGRPPSRELARAALLHDCGKGYIRLHERVVYVLLASAMPSLLVRLARRPIGGMRGALYRIRHHSMVGAEAWWALGASRRECELVARHHDLPDGDAERAALMRADDRA